VRFLNKDDQAHTVTADNGTFGSSFLAKNHAFKFKFTKAGKYPYHCQIHPYMTGTVIVTKS
jgi:plastocyanin